MENNLTIINLMIDKCIELFEQEQKAEFPKDGINYGNPPKRALIAYGVGGKKMIAYQIMDIQKKWLYENGYLKVTDVKRIVDRNQKNGMYYSEASFEFTFDTKKGAAYLNICYGPRYARGIRFELEQKENKAILSNEKVLWIS